MYSSYYSSPMPSNRYLDSNYRSSSSRFSDATSSSNGIGSSSYSNGSTANRFRPPLPTPTYRPLSTHSNNSFSTTPTSSTIKNRQVLYYMTSHYHQNLLFNPNEKYVNHSQSFINVQYIKFVPSYIVQTDFGGKMNCSITTVQKQLFNKNCLFTDCTVVEFGEIIHLF